MATSNNDRVSSARLLDMIKGLQESGHLGSEPEVVTETVEKQHVVPQYPIVGTYTANEIDSAYQAYTDELTLPIYVYGPESDDGIAKNTYNILECEPTIIATLGYKITGTNQSTGENWVYLIETETSDISTYTGYCVGSSDLSGEWRAQHVTNGVGDGWYYYSENEPETYTETTTTKTKRPIKQDYVPNADWNQNDPDGEGYVEGRTHWVERTVGDIPVATEYGISAIPEMVKPEGFKFSTTTWKPDYEAIAFEETQGGGTFTGYLLAEDENGNQITDASSIFGGETFYTGVAIVDFSFYTPGLYLVSCQYDNQQAQADYVLGVTEVVHQLPKKYYEQTDETALKNEIYGYVDEKFVYKALEVPSNTKCGIILDDASELVKFLEFNNYEKTDYSYHSTYTLSSNSRNILVAIHDKVPNRSYTYVAIINNSSQKFTWEYAFTNIISIAMNYNNITWSKLIGENVLIFYTNDDASSFDDKIYWFETDNTVAIDVSDSKLTIGTTYSDRVNFNTNSSKWVIFFSPYSLRKSGDIKYFANGEISKFYSFNTETTYTLDSGNNVKITDIYLNGAYVSTRKMSGKLGGINGNPMSGSEEKTISKNSWFSLVVDDPTFKWEALDELIDVHKIFTFDQVYSGITNTNRLECWFDSNYDLHVKNLESRNVNVPIDFSISFTWFSKFLMPVISRNGVYSSDI